LAPILIISQSSLRERRVSGLQSHTMRQAVGYLLVLWGLSHFFSGSFVALDEAAQATFKAVEVAALASQQQILESQ
jgi:hypothetical protein